MRFFISLFAFISGALMVAAKQPKALDLESGRTIFEDDFSKEKLGKKWNSSLGENAVVGERLSSRELEKDGHSAVNYIKVDADDVIVEFEFEMDDSNGIGISFGDEGLQKSKISHAGHICRVTIFGNTMELRDDKTGYMNQKIRAKRDHPNFEKTFKAYLDKRRLREKIKIKKGRKHTMNVQISGDVMTVRLDGRVIGSLRSEGIGHTPKNKIVFYSPGGRTFFDNIVVSKPKK